MLNSRESAKIVALYAQIADIYEKAKERSCGTACSICAAGDLQSKTVLFRVRRATHGYAHRQAAAPHLCHRHAVGWARSHMGFDPLGQKTDRDVDLHFALYVAKQLEKQARLTTK